MSETAALRSLERGILTVLSAAEPLVEASAAHLGCTLGRLVLLRPSSLGGQACRVGISVDGPLVCIATQMPSTDFSMYCCLKLRGCNDQITKHSYTQCKRFRNALRIQSKILS